MKKEIVEKLSTVPIFQSFKHEREKLEALAARMTPRRVKAGKTLLKEGQNGDEMFILMRGRVEVSKRTIDGEQYTVASPRAEDSAFFGELALLDDDRRSATITAVEDCEVLALSRANFERFGDDHPEVALAIMRELARLVGRKMRNTNEDAALLFKALVDEVLAEETG